MEIQALQTFELIVEDLQSLSEERQVQVADILRSQCGYSASEATQIVTTESFVIARSTNQQELQEVCNALNGTGAKVLIVKQKKSAFEVFFDKYVRGIQKTLASLSVNELEAFVDELLKARANGKRIYVVGNGGSASTASHFATDFAKDRFNDKKLLFKIMSLNDNQGLITASANDTGYENIFSSQLYNLLEPGDLLIAISSSGRSPNIVNAVKYANELGAVTVGISGFSGGDLRKESQNSVHIPTKEGQYGYMEDVSLIINHILSIYIYEQDKLLTEQTN